MTAARNSAMSRPFRVDHKLGSIFGFMLLATFLTVVFIFALVLVVLLLPGFEGALESNGVLPETTDRLLAESRDAVALAGILAGLALAIVAAATLIYRRPLRDFLWPERPFGVRDLAIGFLTTGTLGVALIPLHLAMGSDWSPPILNPLYADWTRPVYFLAMAAAFLLAAAAEEVVCRGVLLRLTALVTQHPILLCLINGLVFSALHLDPDPVAFVARALSGMVWTWAALRLGGLEFAIGAHTAHNLVISLIWSPLSEAELPRNSVWSDLGPEVLTAIIVVAIVERLANGRPDQGGARRVTGTNL
ncbi:MAG: type II CAAX endopeptidase family protein [Brevundimonas sp.]|uniref:CPBP family intramembrane glutamic endopeptidase n=1 Tax=Brevundimonas sp. TaxID=1871086 RepID=UPI0027322D9D|nr:type II CAAX endopeptidase family protein [Brevundimonas sp.]MDP3405488.1 type II CAAX endopeptidase family protein [Brevundimonas sp.]